jgi:hypothetical protein
MSTVRNRLPSQPASLERRLARDEALIAADEARLLADEQRLAAEEHAARVARRLSVLSVALAVALVIGLAGLVIGVLALREDVNAISRAVPENSVGADAIRDAAVTADKLAEGAVTKAAIASGAVGGSELADDAVTSANVRRDSLTGADIRERTLAAVPSAEESQRATHATRLGGLPGEAYLTGVQAVEAATSLDTRATKGPLAARCPVGTRVISGGATVEGLVRDVAIVRSTPDGGAAWAATATGPGDAAEAWRLVVIAVCAVGG